jgi:hypothetical protein
MTNDAQDAIQKLGLYDAWDSTIAPESHRRGSICIDHIYVSTERSECVQKMEYFDFPSKYYTDY